MEKEKLFIMRINLEWRWEDMCGPGGLHPWNPKIRDMGYCFQRLFILIPVLFLLAIVSSFYIGRQINWVVRGRLQERVIVIRSLVSLCLALLPLLKIIRFLSDDTIPVFTIDYFTCGTEFIAWIIHFGYVIALRHRLGVSPRGSIILLVFWSVTAVLSITNLRTLILLKQPYTLAIIAVVFQVIYAITLVPAEGVTSPTFYSSTLIGSQYSQLGEHHPLLQGFIDDEGTLGTAFSGITCLSKLTFHWVNPIFMKGLDNKLKDPDDLFDLPLNLSCSVISTKIDKALIGNVDRFQNTRQTTSNTRPTAAHGNYGATENLLGREEPYVEVISPPKRHNVSLFRALHSCFGFEFYCIGFLKLMGDISDFAGPLLLNKLIIFIQNPSVPAHMGYLYAGGLLLSSLTGAFCMSHFNMYMSIVGLKLRAAIITTIFRKTLSVTSTELSKSFSVGEITNFMSTDTDRIVNFCPTFHALWSIPLQLAVVLYLLYVQVGIAFIAGVLFSIILIPINKYVANKIGALSTGLMRHKDGRVNFMTEIIKNIRTIKLYVWEEFFMNKITDEREKEIKYLKGRKYLDAICVFLWATTPVLVSALTLSTYSLLGNHLTAATVFTTIALLNMLIAPLNAFPWVLNGLAESWVSVKRIQRLLDLQDLNENDYYNNKINKTTVKDIVLSLNNASFCWANLIDTPVEENTVETSSRRSKAKRSISKHVNIQRRDSSVEASGSEDVASNIQIPFQLTNITFEIERGQFFGIIGKVGSGKSSLLSAILAEMIKVDGEILTLENHTGFGYVSQKPWLQRGTIRDNIVFGKAYEESKYRTIIDACGLTDDLALLGNNTCVGEGGSAISGGQAARIALARAVYQDKQIYLFDDILSAVDVKVGAHIYKKCIMGLLKYKTRILVTHSLQYVTQADKILVMENGEIKQQGPPNTVLVELDEYINSLALGDTDSTIFHLTDDISSTMDNISLKDDRSNTSLMEEETSASGSIDFWIIVMYWKNIGHWIGLAIFMSLLLMQISRNTTDIWLSYWVTNITPSNNTNATQMYLSINESYPGNNKNAVYLYNNDVNLQNNEILSDGYLIKNEEFSDLTLERSLPKDNADDQVSFYLSIFAGFAAINALFTLLRAFIFAYGGIQAAVSIHKSLLNILMKGKMRFFDITPAGRLLNRFSSDTYTIDDSLPFIMNILLAQVFGILGSIILTIYGLPWICLVIVPLIPIYHWMQHRYRLTSRELKRLNSVTLSPIYSHFNDTLEGATIIRAFRRNCQWSQNGEHYIERSQRASLCSSAAAQWLGLRLRLMGSAVLTGAAIVAVAQRNFDIVDAGFVGLSITYALSLTSLLSGVINAFTETEREMIAVERVGEYINTIEPEGKDILNLEEISPPYGWPNMGIICFKEVIMKYRPHIAPSLKCISFETSAAEKIGVVGRTGAGKSSLFAALFRLSELQSGSITIDSVDISTLSLTTLRSRIAIIPQDPFIFKGTIRENLDPFEQYSDIELWSALEKCGAKQIMKEKGGLHISATGLSRGHMQLICLTRALLQNSKILCIDEATANIDQETDRLIQETIRCIFKKNTVITIAHRISTILDSDRVLVMDDGQIAEFDRPDKLLNDPGSHFYNLVNQENSG